MQAPSPPSKGDDQYMFNRGYQDSARLVLQHWLWLYRLQYVLHPSVPIHAEHVRIADVGTGNAVWLMELCNLHQLPSKSQLDGFDISPDHFPATEWLPSNVSLGLFDGFGEVPPQLIGVYDVVHIRTFAVIVKSNDPTGLLKNLIKMLSKSTLLMAGYLLLFLYLSLTRALW